MYRKKPIHSPSSISVVRGLDAWVWVEVATSSGAYGGGFSIPQLQQLRSPAWDSSSAVLKLRQMPLGFGAVPVRYDWAPVPRGFKVPGPKAPSPNPTGT
ncbi:hypothetical protein FZEAL_9582 [Fusarium zealandicum]|uniref:Uncharacterized protein n=1 Tax=Fusarium zealandicum TaxID=1053134 RepID=A0A8H4U9Y4_9HYPO|nr:hypothetical protein FZEAL_9582 [Fusarium zealandicum]